MGPIIGRASRRAAHRRTILCHWAHDQPLTGADTVTRMVRTALRATAIGMLVAACAAPAATDESPSAAASASVAPSASIGLDPTPVPHTVATEENPELRDELLAMMA